MLRKSITLAFVVVNTGLFAQSGRISNSQFFTLAKVWGVIKYNHPAVSQGKLDWDSIFLSTIRDQSVQSTDRIISNWITTADAVKTTPVSLPATSCDSITYRNFSTRWLKEIKGLSAVNREKLLHLLQQPTGIGTYYSNPTMQSIRLDSRNEKTYSEFSPDIKLLELARVWNAIAYFYPYKYLLDRNWDNVLKKYIPVFRSIKTEQDYRMAITQFAAEIEDTHTGLKNSYQYDIFGKLAAPFTFQLVDEGAVVTAIKDEKKAAKATIRVGDLITRINNKSIPELITANSKFIPASNQAVQHREAYNYLFSGNDSLCTVDLVHANGERTRTAFERMPRVFANEWDKDGIPEYQLSYHGKTYTYLTWNNEESRLNPGFRLGDKGYIEFSSLQPGDIDSLMKSYLDCKGIVFDLRGYNDNGALLKVFDYLFDQPQFFGIKMQPDFRAPGRFCFVDNIINSDYKYVGKKNSTAYKGKVLVLINEYTQSAEEMWAMIFKKVPGATFIGSQTAGADGNITGIKLTDGNELRFSGLGIYYPDGGETQRIGIRPDIAVRPTLQSIREKQDVLLQTAFDQIDKL